MEKTQAIVPLAAIAALCGVLARHPAVAEHRDTHAAAGSSTAATPSTIARQAADDEGLDTLDVIGDSLGTDVTSEGLRRRTARALKVLAAPGTAPGLDWSRAFEFLESFLALPIRPDAPHVDDARRALTEMKAACGPGEHAPARPAYSPPCQRRVDTVRRFLTAYLNQDALKVDPPDWRTKLLAQDFAAVNKTPLKLAALRRSAADQQVQVDFLIATLPDPIDSYTGWQFDPMLDAIAQAISASDFVLDRFHLPDSDPADDHADGAGAPAHRLHEIEPGVVIFRRHLTAASGAADSRQRLVLLIAHENPSAGVHAPALASAIRLVINWHNRQAAGGAGDRPAIRILGPTFSGSSDSVRRALTLVRRAVIDGGYHIRVVSGSATDPANQATIETAIDRDHVRFQATVQPDDVLLPPLLAHLASVQWSFPMAVLFEANTQYGREMWETLSAQDLARSPAGSPDPPRLIQLPFPMNLSRLRTTVQPGNAGLADTVGVPSRFRSLSMEETGSPVDKLPQFHASTAAAYAELALSQMLQTMKQERVKTVALLATDPRDKLFLAQEIARSAPDVSIVTVESESLYIHPDYASYLQGALVVSTYPLYSANQRWSYGFEGRTERRHFANGAAQGIYNAALALLHYDADGVLLPLADSSEKPPRLLEYGPPGGACGGACQPPVWISVIGRSTAWPVRSYAPPSASGEARRGSRTPYVFTVRAQGTRGVPEVIPSPLFTAMFLVLAVAVIGFWAHARSTWWNGADDGARANLRPCQLACITSLIVMELFIGLLFVVGPVVEPPAWRLTALAVVGLALGLLVDLLARLALGTVARSASPSPGDRRSNAAAVAGALAIGSACGWGLWCLARYVADHLLHQEDAVSFVTRAVNLGSGVSPTLPVILLGLVVFLWGLIELAQRRGPRVALADPAVRPLLQQAVHGNVEELQAPWNGLARSMFDLPWPWLTVAALALATTCIFAFDPFVAPLVTVEGPWFGRFISTALLVVQGMLVLSLLQFVFLWSRLDGLLRRMAWHDVSAAYERIPRDLFPTGLLPRVPRLMELHALVAQWQRCVHAAGWSSPRSTTMPDRCLALRSTFEDEMRGAPMRGWSTSETWKALASGAAAGMATLRGERSDGRMGAPLPTSPRAASSEGGHGTARAMHLHPVDQAEPQPAARAHEDLVAMSMALVIRDALARLGHNLVFVIAGVLLVFCSQTLFPFQARQRLELLAWIYIGLSFTAILVVLVQMKRNEIVGRLTSATPGQRATWDGAFILKLAVFGLLPLLTLFAAQFPEIGGALLSWLEPVQKALP